MIQIGSNFWRNPPAQESVSQLPLFGGIHFNKKAPALEVFTTLATLGTPQDVTAQEIRIECFFPANAATADVFKRWAEG